MANTVDLKSTDESLVGSSPTVDTNWIAWAAGLFEGEGSAFLVNQKTKGKNYPYTRMELHMTDEDVVIRFQKVLGVGRIYYKPSRNPKWKDSWTWQLTNKEECRQVIDKFWPYLGERRRAKILELEL